MQLGGGGGRVHGSPFTVRRSAFTVHRLAFWAHSPVGFRSWEVGEEPNLFPDHSPIKAGSLDWHDQVTAVVSAISIHLSCGGTIGEEQSPFLIYPSPWNGGITCSQASKHCYFVFPGD
jgi:hypothetical protein